MVGIDELMQWLRVRLLVSSWTTFPSDMAAAVRVNDITRQISLGLQFVDGIRHTRSLP